MTGVTVMVDRGPDAATARGRRRFSSGPGGFVNVGVVGTVLAALAASLLGAGLASHGSTILDGNTWVVALRDDGTEHMLRVNPGSGAVDIEQSSPLPPGAHAVVHQSNITTAVVAADGGSVFAYDALDNRWVRSDTRVSGSTRLHLTAEHAFVMDAEAGLLRQLRPRLLDGTVGPELSLGRGIEKSLVDGSGLLWLAWPANGRVVAVAGTPSGPVVRREFGLPRPSPDLTLTALRDGVLANDRAGKVVYRIDPERSEMESITGVPARTWSRTAVTSDDDTGAVLDEKAGTVVRVAPAGDPRLDTFRIGASRRNHVLGTPVVFGNRIYIADRTTGTLLRTPASGTELEVFPRQRLGDTGFDLFVDDGRLWVNARSGRTAFAINRDGTRTDVAKAPTGRISPPRKPLPARERPDRGREPASFTPTPRGTGGGGQQRLTPTAPPQVTPSRAPSPRGEVPPPGRPVIRDVSGRAGTVTATFEIGDGGPVDSVAIASTTDPGVSAEGDARPGRITVRFPCGQTHDLVLTATGDGGSSTSDPWAGVTSCRAAGAPAVETRGGNGWIEVRVTPSADGVTTTLAASVDGGPATVVEAGVWKRFDVANGSHPVVGVATSDDGTETRSAEVPALAEEREMLIYDNYGPANQGYPMCTGNPNRPESMPAARVSQTMTVPEGVGELRWARVQIDPQPNTTVTAQLLVNGSIRATDTDTAAGDSIFHFEDAHVTVSPGDTAELTFTFAATWGKLVTIYSAGSPGGTFKAENSCSDGAPTFTKTNTGLRAQVFGINI
jgi:hypothetical protein